MKSIKIGKQKRYLQAAEVRAGSETEAGVLQFSFSSEQPVRRWFGHEVLSHTPGAADLTRLNGGAQVLFNHDMDSYVGVVERAWIGDDKRGYCSIRFSDSEKNELAAKVRADVEAKILKNVSFGYEIREMKLTREDADGGDEYTATNWAPYEISFVTIPADPSIGVGRSMDEQEQAIEVPIINANDNPKDEALAPAMGETQMSETQVDVKALQADAQKLERERIASIQAMGEKFSKGDLARKLVVEGHSLDQARAAFLEEIGAVQKPIAANANDVDLSDKEQRSYSIIRAINAVLNNNWKHAGLEREVSEEIAKRSGKQTAGFFMPMNLRAAYNTQNPEAAGNLVQLKHESFVEMLRNKALVTQMGAKFLSGLVGNVAIPKQTAATVAYWVTEGAAIPEDESMRFGLTMLSPKQIGARSQVTRLMLQQSTPDIENLVKADLSAQLALGIDLAAIFGTGTAGQPTGILNQDDIATVVGGTNGAAITIDHLIDLETAVAVNNADFGSLGYVVNAKAIGALKKLKTAGGQYAWTQEVNGGRSATPGSINGYPVFRTNQIGNNLTKGTANDATAVIFGNWSDLIIGEWGTLEILPNPYGAGFNSGALDIRAMQTVDVAVRHPESFAAMTDALT